MVKITKGTVVQINPAINIFGGMFGIVKSFNETEILCAIPVHKRTQNDVQVAMADVSLKLPCANDKGLISFVPVGRVAWMPNSIINEKKVIAINDKQ